MEGLENHKKTMMALFVLNVEIKKVEKRRRTTSLYFQIKQLYLGSKNDMYVYYHRCFFGK
ncbi:hypothetical protein HMPREF0083_03909 [Aneurinibacillus aneurinilyticus ATCC 12856]|uniref:Uncharacterized protein n=1 Tax=Aneurinibacillus aneurinilyticus ATCC 12856 TaxID=649747 RepID=U1X0H0_ANEAE|nr:hypothetical protein HMPREF0083_03909 [Aneurinibacillus aneurinilyticus ATCC 12856]